MRRTLAAVVVAALALTGCAGPDEKTGGAALQIVIDGDRIEPNGERVEVGVGETVVLEIESDRTAELHVHSSPEQELSVEEGTSRVELVIDTPGVIDVEEHETGVVVYQLEVR